MLRISIQPTRLLTTKRVDNGWIVWISGSPETERCTYLYLYDNGNVERVTETPDGVDVFRIEQ